MNEREEFEKVWRDKWCRHTNIPMNCAWWGWEERAALAAPAQQEPTELEMTHMDTYEEFHNGVDVVGRSRDYIRLLEQTVRDLRGDLPECLCETCNTVHLYKGPGLFQSCPDCGSTMMPTSYNLRKIAALKHESDPAEALASAFFDWERAKAMPGAATYGYDRIAETQEHADAVANAYWRMRSAAEAYRASKKGGA